MSKFGKIVQEVALDGGFGRLVRFDYAGSGRLVCENLMLLDADGNIKWKAKLPGMPDFFVSFQLEDGEIFANSFSGYYIKIDKYTGKQLECEFVK